MNALHKVVLAAATGAISVSIAACGQTFGTLPAGAQAGAAQAQAVSGEIVVKFKSTKGQQALTQSLGLRTVKKVDRLGAVVVKASGDAKDALAKLNADKANVLYAEPNFVYKAFAEDELMPKTWEMAKIEAPAVWPTYTGKGVTVAVVDTGIDYTHPDFGGRVDKGHDFVNNDDDAMDDHYHGTHCAGSIGAGIHNGGIVGVAPEVSLIAVKVLSKTGSGSLEGVANGITYAADRGAQIISMSLGGPSSAQTLEDAVQYAIGKGALVVVAMGNDNTEKPSYPAASKGVMAVGATTSDDTRAYFSNFGAHISVGAPGHNILSTVPGGGYKLLSGTSMATPNVAGLAAVVKQANPGFTAQQIRQRIEQTADDLGEPGFDKQFGYGRINARKAVGL